MYGTENAYRNEVIESLVKLESQLVSVIRELTVEIKKLQGLVGELVERIPVKESDDADKERHDGIHLASFAESSDEE